MLDFLELIGNSTTSPRDDISWPVLRPANPGRDLSTSITYFQANPSSHIHPDDVLEPATVVIIGWSGSRRQRIISTFGRFTATSTVLLFDPDTFSTQRVREQVNLPALRGVMEQLEQIATLEPDWDSYGAQRPSQTAIEQARHLIETVAMKLINHLGAEAIADWVGPLPNGGIEVDWEVRGKDFSIDVNTDGSLHYIIVDRRIDPPKYETEQRNVTVADVVNALREM
jgi:hypothetical protein